MAKLNVAAELAALSKFERESLLLKWRDLYQTEPPNRISVHLLNHSIAYKIQEQSLGGLKPATRKLLEKAAQGKTDIGTSVGIKPGMRLIRDWHGITYEVTISEDVIICNGKTYRSLSQLARVITGTPRSGHLFFGLKRGGSNGN